MEKKNYCSTIHADLFQYFSISVKKQQTVLHSQWRSQNVTRGAIKKTSNTGPSPSSYLYCGYLPAQHLFPRHFPVCVHLPYKIFHVLQRELSCSGPDGAVEILSAFARDGLRDAGLNQSIS